MIEHLTYVWDCLKKPLKNIFALFGIAICFTLATISVLSAIAFIAAAIVLLVDAAIWASITAIIMCAGAFFVAALSIVGILACFRIIAE